MNITVTIPDSTIEAIAQRAAELVAPVETDGWLRGASRIAEYLDCPVSRVYSLVSVGRLSAIERDGSALIARKSALDRWIEDGGGIRP